ncbi:MAG: histidine phosphotransferase family protein [Sphingomonas fennica]
MTDPIVDIASLFCSRLCHDLLSPVGAIGNGLELMADEDDPAMRARCLELIAESTRAATDKLKFYRLAFGAAGSFGDQMDCPELLRAIEGISGGKVEIAWAVEQRTLARRTAKVLLNLAILGVDALPRGGTLTIAAEEAGGVGEVVVRAEGPRLAADQQVLSALAGTDPQPTSRNAAAWLAARLAGPPGAVQVAEQDGVLMLGARLA